jgi:hypothetical protein
VQREEASPTKLPRGVFGYRRRDVERALAQIEARVDQTAAALEGALDENWILRAEREQALAEARRELGEAEGRITSLVRVREEFLGELRGLVEATTEVIERADRPASAPVAALSQGSEMRLDVGTFSDYAQLARFERSLLNIPSVVDLHVTKFEHGRASFELRLDQADSDSVAEAIEKAQAAAAG